VDARVPHDQAEPRHRRHRRRWARLAAVTAVVIGLCVAVPAAASAATPTTRTDFVTGAEYAATSTRGSFAGPAIGQFPGTFDAKVDHTPLVADSATITGGTFTVNSRPGVRGTVTGGSIEPRSAPPGCADHELRVRGTLAITAPAAGTGSFDVVETHVQRIVLGQCRIVFATIVGTLVVRY